MRTSQACARPANLASLLVLLSIAAVGCSTTGAHVRWYDGGPKPESQVAVIKVQRNIWDRSARVKTIDGEPLSKSMKINNTQVIELLPGTHTVAVEYFDSNGGTSTQDAMLTFGCMSNHVYELHVAPIDEGGGKAFSRALIGGKFYWTAWVIDSETQEVVAGRKRDEPLRWYEK